MRILGWSLAFAIIVACGCAKAATPMSIAAFRDAYIAELKREAPSATVRILADNVLEVTGGNRKVETAYLDNAYGFYKQDPSQLNAILKQYVSRLLTIHELTSFTAAQLRILVRPTSYLLPDMPPDKKPLYHPLAGELIALVAVDEPLAFEFPPATQLRTTLRLSDDALWARALENTDRKLPGVPSNAGKAAIAAFTTGEGLASSMLAEPRLWDTPEIQAGGPPVVAPVDRNLVFMARAGDAARVAALRKAAAESASDPNGLTSQLFVRRNGAWEVLP